MSFLTHSVFFACFLLAAGLFPVARAQVCAPDPSTPAGGATIPSSIPDGCIGVPYSQVISNSVPADTSISLPPFGTINVTIDSVIMALQGLPPGMSFQCLFPGCRYVGGATGCILISGTPTTAGTYNIELLTTSYAVVFGSQTTQNDVTLLYTMQIRPSPVATLVSTTDASCGMANGTATVAASGGNGSLSFLWANGQTGTTAIGLAAGIHLLTVSDANGCSDQIGVAIGNTGAPTAGLNPAASKTLLDCFGHTDGAISMDVSGGIPPYTFSWNTGDTTSTISGLPAGTYNCAITAADSCVSVFSQTVQEPGQLDMNLNIINVKCAGDSSGIVSAQVIGGTWPFAYSWSNGMSSTVTINWPAGMHSLTLTDANGCARTKNFTISEPDPIILNVNITNVSAPGANDGAVSLVQYGGLAPFSYSWSNGASTGSISGLAPGTYFLLVTDANGCEKRDTAVINLTAVSMDENLHAAGIEALHIYPNPAQSEIRIRLSQNDPYPVLIELIDVHGNRALLQTSDPGRETNTRLDLESLSAGLYQLLLHFPNRTFCHKIMKRP